MIDINSAYRIFAKNNIDIIPVIGEVVSIKGQRRWAHPNYSDSYRVGPVDVQMIIVKELPKHNTQDNINLISFKDAVSYKYELLNNSNDSYQHNKHLLDLNRIIINFNYSIQNYL